MGIRAPESRNVSSRRLSPRTANIVRAVSLFRHCRGSRLSSLRRRLAKEADRENEQDQIDRDLDNHLETGFQLATFQGPLCAEPVEGLAYFVESIEIDRAGIDTERGEIHIVYSSQGSGLTTI